MLRGTLKVAGPLFVLIAGACSGVDTDAEAPNAAPSAAPGQPETAPSPQASETVTVYWSSNENGNTVTRSEQISKQQAQDLLAKRAANKAAYLRGEAQAIDSLAGTVWSNNWQASCQHYQWFLLTSGPNGTGNIFCAKYAGGQSPAAHVPFVPAYFDRSNTYINSLCTADDSECGVWECFIGSSVWNYWYPGYETGNISPPSSARYVVAQGNSNPC
jgi:hypothetical protein